MNRCRDMTIQNFTRWLMDAILDLVQSQVWPFDLSTPKTYSRTKHKVNQMTCMLPRYGHSKFSKMRGMRSVVGRSVVNIYIDVMYTPLRYVRNVAKRSKNWSRINQSVSQKTLIRAVCRE